MSRRTSYEFEGPAPDQPVWWTSLDDYAQQTTAPEARANEAAAEHPEGAWDFSDPVSRRTFMTLMGASISLATLQGCRRPADKILPYSRAPEDVTVNVTSFYATVIDRRGEGVGLLVESHEGRPTKAEGNPDHPASRGKTDLLTQAAVLDLYDPDRSRKPSKAGAEKTFADFEGELRAALTAHAANGGTGLRVLAPPSISPTFVRLRDAVKRRFPNARFHTWEAATAANVRAGARLAFGQAVAPVYDLARAKRVVSIDSDFLQTEPGVVRNTRGWSESRRVRTPEDEPSRLYVVESVFSTTGGNADHRLRLAARDVEGYLMALGAALAAGGADLGGAAAAVRGATAPAGVDAKWVEKVAADLLAHRGESAVIVGSRQPATAHALGHAINQALGNVGATVRYAAAADPDESDDHAADLAALATAMGAREVQTLLILGGNPVYDAPGEHDFGAKLAGVQLSVHLGLRRDETGEKCTWHVPGAHWLEAWGDAQSLDGTYAIQQPLIQPLFSGRSALELLGLVADAPSHRGYELVRETFRARNPGNAFERQWRRALNVGVAGEAPAAVSPALRGAEIAAAYGRRTAPSGALSKTNLEAVFTVDAKMYDGRHANNAWLQELPDPVTKITWDNAAVFSPKTAEELGIRGGDLVRVTKGSRTVEIVAWVLPGHPDNTVALPMGWGRTQAGRVGNGKGFNVNPLRPAGNVWFAEGFTVAAAGSRYPLSQTQDHHRMENRPIAIETTLASWREHPNFAERASPTPRTLPLWRAPYTYAEGHKWGMSIDLNACTGCNACVVACQSENNIPVVGKDQVARGREMHWLRVDRYFVSPRGQGDADALSTSDPLMAVQPLGCVHCENAPCENVCPVAATVHSPEGLNEMAYNRCIGTRYCANNCPYKVRRFNYLNWHNDGVYQPEDNDMPETVRMAMNPNVTVRFRGVMEKCTYCVQRIQSRKIESKRENRDLRDGEVVTACQQACPADAIVFGDLNLRDARVTALSRDLRRYKLLGEIGTQPRTTYLARVRNPNPEMQG